jgi:predicted lipid-binding transport protein (Tim44 family)
VFAAFWLLMAALGHRGVRRVARSIVDGAGDRAVARRAHAAESAALVADGGDGYWHPHLLKTRVAEAFFPIQGSWAARDISASRPYVSDALYERHRLQLEGLEAQRRVNRIEDLRLIAVEIVRVHNVADDDEDRFVARIRCSARDWMEDAETGSVVNGNPRTPTTFEQYWSFSRHPEFGWVLDEIQQGTEGAYHLKAPLVNSDDGPAVAATV